jgi:ADP-ribose pyrophosphatase
VIARITEPNEITQSIEAHKSQLRAQGLPESWAEVGEVYVDPYIRVLRDPVRFKSGRTGTYIRVEPIKGSPGGVIAVTQIDGKYLLLLHSRYATGKLHYEFPRGFIDAGETPEQALTRELREEISASAVKLSPLGVIYADTGLLNIPVHVFFAEIESFEIGDCDEGIESVEILTTAELLALVASGAMDDSLTMAALLLHQSAVDPPPAV